MGPKSSASISIGSPTAAALNAVGAVVGGTVIGVAAVALTTMGGLVAGSVGAGGAGASGAVAGGSTAPAAAWERENRPEVKQGSRERHRTSAAGIFRTCGGGNVVGIHAEPNANSCDMRSVGRVGVGHQEGRTGAGGTGRRRGAG